MEIILSVLLVLFASPVCAQIVAPRGVTAGVADGKYVNVAGDTMTGPLTLAGSSLTVTGAGSFGDTLTMAGAGLKYAGAGNFGLTFTGLTLQADSGGAIWNKSGTGNLSLRVGDPAVIVANFEQTGAVTIPGSAFSVGTSTFVVTGGKVGVGTAPGSVYDFHFKGSVNDRATFERANAANRLDIVTGNALEFINTNAFVDVESGKSIFLRVADVAKLTVSGDNVGIGTSAPTDKLDISSGTIRMAGTGSPTVGYALCLTATGAMGHCTAVTAADGSCTCVTP